VAAEPVRDTQLIKGHSHHREENTMLVFLYLEARQPNGVAYHLGLGCFVPPNLASMIVMLLRLF